MQVIAESNGQRKKLLNILIILTPVDTAGKLWKRWSILKKNRKKSNSTSSNGSSSGQSNGNVEKSGES